MVRQHSVRLVTTMASWMISRLLTRDARCRSCSRGVREYPRCSKKVHISCAFCWKSRSLRLYQYSVVRHVNVYDIIAWHHVTCWVIIKHGMVFCCIAIYCADTSLAAFNAESEMFPFSIPIGELQSNV